MSHAPTLQTKFEAIGWAGSQHVEGGHTRIKMLFAIADQRKQWAAWYVFVQDLRGAAYKAIFEAELAGTLDASVEFAGGNIEGSPFQTRRATRVDQFARSEAPATNSVKQSDARLHDATFTKLDRHPGWRMDGSFSIDLRPNKTDLETVRMRLSMFCPERPQGTVHPAVGFIAFRKLQKYSEAILGPDHASLRVMRQAA